MVVWGFSRFDVVLSSVQCLMRWWEIERPRTHSLIEASSSFALVHWVRWVLLHHYFDIVTFVSICCESLWLSMVISALFRSRDIAVRNFGRCIDDLRRILAVIIRPLLLSSLSSQATTLFKGWIRLVNETRRLQFLLGLYSLLNRMRMMQVEFIENWIDIC